MRTLTTHAASFLSEASGVLVKQPITCGYVDVTEAPHRLRHLIELAA
ncbi:MAG: hypothetical protein AAF170_13105 [Bacteroidota bacterium]